MDDQRLDTFFQERLESLTEKDYGVEGWESLPSGLGATPSTAKPYSFSKIWLPASLMVMLGLNIALLYIIGTQQTKVDALSQQITTFEQLVTQRVVHRDTLVIYQNEAQPIANVFPSSKQEWKTLSKIFDQKVGKSHQDSQNGNSFSYPPPSKQLSVGYSLFSPLEQSIPIGSDINERVIIESLQKLQDGARDSSYLSKGDKNIENNSNNSLETPKESQRKKRKRSYSLGEFLKYSDVQVGISIKKPTPNPEFGLAKATIQPSLALGFIMPNERWLIETGLGWYKISFDSDDLDQINPAEISLAKYPNIQNAYSLDRIHEIYMNASVIEIPLALRYNFHDGYRKNLFVKSGLAARWFVKQDFIYEFLLDIGNKPQVQEQAKNTFSYGTFLFEVGGEMAIDKKTSAELGFFYTHDFFGQGIEKSRYKTLGIQGTVWFNSR